MKKEKSLERSGVKTTEECKRPTEYNLSVFRDKYEAMLVQEKSDRIAYHDEKLAPVKAQLDGIT